MQTVCFKEHGGIVHNPIAQLSPIPSVPWWSACGAQTGNGESFGQLKAVSMEHSSHGNQLTATIQKAEHGTHGPEKENNTSQFTIFPGQCKDSGKELKGQKAFQAAISCHSSSPEYQARFELGLGQPIVCANYPYMDQYYGVFATYGARTTGRVMLPLSLTTDDGPIFVNAKQYHGIIRRRQSRAKAELENKVIRGRKRYLHESRHLHAMRRPRGCGGRFLNKNSRDSGKDGIDMKKAVYGQNSQTSGSPSSESIQAESGRLNSMEACRSSSSLSELGVTNMYSRGDLDHFQVDHLRSSAFHSISNAIDGREHINMPNKWVAAADGCCNLLKV